MYATCLNCHAPLGANEMLERFPVGRTLAIDAAKGRLWVVCTVCKQWNLSPIEERWEAIEDGERLFHDARLRASTDNIGIARLGDGTELIRVGKALRPEFAAWRYGERFRRRYILNAPGAAVIGVAGFAAKGVGGIAAFQAFGLPLIGLAAVLGARNAVRHLRRIVPVELPNGERTSLTMAQVETMRLLIDPTSPTGWQLRFRHSPTAHQRRHNITRPEVVVKGAEALRYAMRFLPRVNRVGGLKRTVEEAVGFLERAGSPDAVFRMASRVDPSSSKTQRGALPDEISSEGGNNDLQSPFVRADAYIRLAVEMAAHDEQERAVLEGELAELERQWKEADEIAGIADSLTLPPAVLAQLERFRLR